MLSATLRSRRENLWVSEQTCVVHLVEPTDVMHKLVYVATNPVKDPLFEKAHHWPGVNGLAALLGGCTLHATLPRHFFRPNGPMLAAVTLPLAFPPELGDPVPLLDELRARAAAMDAAIAVERSAPVSMSWAGGRSAINRGVPAPRAWSLGAIYARGSRRVATNGRASRRSAATANSWPPIAMPGPAGSAVPRSCSPPALIGSGGSRTFL